MRNYILLDGSKYKTNSENWVETETCPRQFRRLLSSAGDVTFSINSFFTWTGEIFVDAVAKGGFGTLATLEATLRKKSALTMEDHRGTSRSVTISPSFKKVSTTPDWEGPDNEFHIEVEINTL